MDAQNQSPSSVSQSEELIDEEFNKQAANLLETFKVEEVKQLSDGLQETFKVEEVKQLADELQRDCIDETAKDIMEIADDNSQMDGKCSDTDRTRNENSNEGAESIDNYSIKEPEEKDTIANVDQIELDNHVKLQPRISTSESVVEEITNESDSDVEMVSEDTPNNDATKPTTEDSNNHVEEETQPTEFYLHISNVPITWKKVDVKEFVLETFRNRHVKFSKNFKNIVLKEPHNDQCRGAALVFDDKSVANAAKKILRRAKLQHNNIYPVFKTELYPQDDTIIEADEHPKSGARIFRKKFNDDIELFQPSKYHYNKMTYGLSHKFLKSLNIKPGTLYNRLLMTDCSPELTVPKITEVFSLAGKVLYVCNSRVKEGSFKIAYEHPVEAVQAISMFQGQKLLGHEIVLKMCMNYIPPIIIPEGLEDMGRGLGPKGRPLQSVSFIAKIQELQNKIDKLTQRFVETCSTTKTDQNPKPFVWEPTANPAKFTPTQPPISHTPDNQNLQALLQMMMQKIGDNPSTANWQLPTPQNPVMQAQGPIHGNRIGRSEPGQIWSFGSGAENTGICEDFSSLQANVDRSSQWKDSNAGPMRPKHQQYRGRRTFDRTNQRQPFKGGQPFERVQPFVERQSFRGAQPFVSQAGTSVLSDEASEESSDMVSFKYLPPILDLKELKSKLHSTVGPTRFVEMQGNGRAFVRFHNVHDAKHCVELFNMSRVEGQIIKVSFC